MMKSDLQRKSNLEKMLNTNSLREHSLLRGLKNEDESSTGFSKREEI